MSVQMVLLPVFVLVGLTFALLLWMRGGRRHGLAGGRDVAPGGVAEIGELPLLFYVLIALAMPLRHADLVIVMLSWVFVVTRFAHAGVLATSDDAGHRSMAWFASALVLFAMWLYFALKILLLI
jgi:hypothetical protein